jgi:hypothetical protein
MTHYVELPRSTLNFKHFVLLTPTIILMQQTHTCVAHYKVGVAPSKSLRRHRQRNDVFAPLVGVAAVVAAVSPPSPTTTRGGGGAKSPPRPHYQTEQEAHNTFVLFTLTTQASFSPTSYTGGYESLFVPPRFVSVGFASQDFGVLHSPNRGGAFESQLDMASPHYGRCYLESPL